jgi:hypothetical protein
MTDEDLNNVFKDLQDFKLKEKQKMGDVNHI